MLTRRKLMIHTAQAATLLAVAPQAQAAQTMTPQAATQTAPPVTAPQPWRLPIGSCMIGLPEAKAAGLDGVEINVGPVADRLQIAASDVRRRYKEQMEQTGLAVRSLMMGLLNGAPLASDPRGPAWLEQSIEAAHDLGAPIVLVAFFGKGDLLDEQNSLKRQDVDIVIERLRAAAPAAKDAGVTLAIENTLPAEENVRILDRIGHEAVQIYYDVFNTGIAKGYDAPAEIRLLKRRIVQVHYKNGPQYLEDRPDHFEAVTAALRAIEYAGWIVLETSSPSKDPIADARKNAAYVRRLLAGSQTAAS